MSPSEGSLRADAYGDHIPNETESTMPASHTPTPWHVHYGHLGAIEVRDERENYVAMFGNPNFYTNAESDAERIVLCVNAHDALVEALAGLVEHVDAGRTNSYCEVCGQHAPKDDGGRIIGPIPCSASCSYRSALAALKLARGEA